MLHENAEESKHSQDISQIEEIKVDDHYRSNLYYLYLLISATLGRLNLEHHPTINHENWGKNIGLESEDENLEKTKEVSIKFFTQQLLDIGDILGALIIVVLLKKLSKGPVNNISFDEFKIFVIELSVEFICELIFTLIIWPLIRKWTILKEFEPTKTAKVLVFKNIGWYILLSILTYPMLLFIMLCF